MAWTTFRDFCCCCYNKGKAKVSLSSFSSLPMFSHSLLHTVTVHHYQSGNCQRNHLWVPYKSGFSERQFTSSQSYDYFHLCVFLVHGLVISPAPDVTNPDDALNFNLNPLECNQTPRLGWVSVL